MAVIALMTDFGTTDYYVGAMKGVILQINPKAAIVDITHEIGSQDLYHGAFVLRQALPCFPAETVIVAVVDPTVGGPRRILAARYSGRTVLAPDNGLISLLHRDAELQEIRIVEQRQLFASSLSNTFHGRDIFAPVAGHLSKGMDLERVGPPADRLAILDLAKPMVDVAGVIHGEVVLVDHFGNLITNVSSRDLAVARGRKQQATVTVGTLPVGPICTTYGDVPVGEPVALIGSAQMLEIAVNSGNASQRLNVHRGDPVCVRWG